MANVITAGNSSNGGTAITTDTSGTLNIVTGSGSGATAIAVDTSQSTTLNSAASTAPFIAKINGTEAARIDSSGNLLVGNASQIWDERLSARNSTNTVLAGFYAQSTSYTSSVIRAQAETAAGTGWYLFEGRSSAGTFQYGIRGNGTVATSDERRKKNIEPARSYIDDICKIRVVKYNWKGDEDTTPKELGWIAQEVAEVFPNMVVTHYDGPNDDQEVLLLKKEVFVPMLMKCIQELKAELDAIKAKVGV